MRPMCVSRPDYLAALLAPLISMASFSDIFEMLFSLLFWNCVIEQRLLRGCGMVGFGYGRESPEGVPACCALSSDRFTYLGRGDQSLVILGLSRVFIALPGSHDKCKELFMERSVSCMGNTGTYIEPGHQTEHSFQQHLRPCHSGKKEAPY